MRLFSWLRQVAAVTWFNVINVKERLGSSTATVVGIAGVVMVFIGVLSIATGFQATMAATGDPENVLVMRSGSDSEMTSGLGLETTKLISDHSKIEQGPAGPVASAELFVIVDVPKRSTGTPANVPLRGVSPAAFAVRPRFELVEGRHFEAGRNEIIVGRAAADQFAGLGVGESVRWGENTWQVVGIFTTGGTAEDTEIWTDAKVLQPAYRRGNSYQSVHLRLASAADFEAFKSELESNPQLNVKVIRENDYYAEQSETLSNLIKTLGILIGGLMGFGAIFGALNTMYTAVSARTREIATLRALGFSAGPVVISVIVEAVLLALVGGVLGAGLAYALFNGFQAATLNFQTFSQIAFAFAVTVPLIIGGLLYALLMGFIGGFFPAIRAARLPVATALREL